MGTFFFYFFSSNFFAGVICNVYESQISIQPKEIEIEREIECCAQMAIIHLKCFYLFKSIFESAMEEGNERNK